MSACVGCSVGGGDKDCVVHLGERKKLEVCVLEVR